MRPDAEFDSDPYLPPPVVVRLYSRRATRYRLVPMDGPIEPRSGHDADGKTELDPPPNDMQNLFTGLDNGFGKVMVELSQIRHDMTNLPLQTAEALSGQLQTLSLGNTNDKGQTVRTPFFSSLMHILRASGSV